MESFGEMLRRMREEKGDPIRVVAAFLDVDPAIVSKIERGHRKATREQVSKLAGYFGTGEGPLLVAWLSDRILYDVEGEDLAEEALKVAEEKIAYRRAAVTTNAGTLARLKAYFKQDGRIKQAWVFGSFAREDDRPGSDIDILVEERDKAAFSYFDLADIQYHLEKLLHRKVDIGFIGSLKEGIEERVMAEAKLVYEKG